MATGERRFHLGLLTRDAQKREEQIEKMKEQSTTKTGKGKRSTRVSGSQLRSKLQSGEIK